MDIPPYSSTLRRNVAAPSGPNGPNGPGFGFKESHGHQATGALALLQALSLATSGSLGTQVNTMA